MVVRLTLETLGGCHCGSMQFWWRGANTCCRVPAPVCLAGRDDAGNEWADDAAEIARDPEDVATTPVVFMTANVQLDEVAHYRELGAVDVIVRPFDSMTLSSQIEEIWARCHD